MSDDLFELFEKDDEEKRRGRRHRTHHKHGERNDDDDHDDDGGVSLAEHWSKASKNKWLLAGIIIGGIILIAVAIFVIVLLLPLAAEYWTGESVRSGAEIAKSANSLVGE